MPLSLAPKATMSEFLRFTSCASLYILTVQLLSNSKYIKFSVFVVTGIAALIAFLAILQRFTSPETIYWMRKVAGNNPFGPWVNRNHYAGFMEMVSPLVLSLFLYYKPKIRYQYSWRQRLTMAISMPEANIHTLLGLSALLIIVSIFLCLSRSGITSATLSLFLFCLLVTWRNYSSKNITLGATFFLFVILSVSWFGWQPIIDRFENVLNEAGTIADARPQVWQDSANIIKDFPVTGTGFGTFTDIYRAYRSVPGRGVFSHAHNDYIELMTTGGIISAVLSLCFFISLFSFTINLIKTRKEKFSILIFYGCACGIFAIFLHSFTDFNLQIGANAYYFFFICGLMVAASSTRRHKGLKNGYLKTYNNIFIQSTTLPVLLLLVTTLLFHIGQLRSINLYTDVQNAILYKGMNTERLKILEDKTRSAITYDPLEPKYFSGLANIQFLQGGQTATVPSSTHALKLNPLSCEALQQLANGFTDTNLNLSRSLYKISVSLNQQRGDCISRSAEWFFNINERAQALEILNQALRVDTDKAKYFFALIEKHNLSEKEIFSIFPQDSVLFIQYANRLWQAGNEIEALAVYEKGIQLLRQTMNIKPWFFHRGYSWYKKHAMDDKAFELIQKAVRWIPDNIAFHELLGDLYHERNITYRAEEEYNKALSLDPSNKNIRKKITELKKD